jgi:hypothetical protein
MNARQELDSYISQLERRVRLDTLSRGAAIVAAAALGATVVLVLLANLRAFSEGSVIVARLTLFCILVFAASMGLAIPISRLSRRRAARKAEEMFPEFQQRLVTFAERKGDAGAFLELLAADTLDVASCAPPAALAPGGRLLAVLGAGIVSLGVLLWMIVAGPGFLGYGAHLLWTGSGRGAAPQYDLTISPGDATVRRHADQLVTAQTVGILSPRVVLYARYQSTSKWEQVAMQPRPSASGYQFVFTSVPENVEYYVEAGARRSPHFNIRVVDLPSIKQIKVTYHYPSWTGLKDLVEERGGDLRALEGTRAELEVMTDRPLQDGLLVLDHGQQVRLSGGKDNRYQGAIQVDRDGAYHVAGLEQGQAVRLSEDFFIEARKASVPTVSIARPGGDYRASAIEEVTVAVRAEDEFGLKDLDLRYSVNGGPEQSVRLLKKPDEKQVSGSSVLALEDFKLVPGDLVSVYATAKDARSESHSDMLFIQVDPFEREFSQSQQAGGGGGGGGGGQRVDPGEISRREKEIVAATFKQQSDKKATEKQAAETAKFLSDVQATLRDQSVSLSGRLQARELTRESKEFSTFQQEMAAAAEAMDPASQKLQGRKWQQAIPDEQKALQHLLRAEATFRQIEVAFGARGGGAGGGGSAGRDLASLFDLELDTEKNQYETQQTASSADQRAEDINEALKKLDELARREETLARRQRDSAQSFEQRWQQEMLQREAEQLQRQIEQLAQNGKQGGQQAGGQSGQQAGGQGGQQAGQGRSGSSGQPDSSQRPGEPGQPGQSQSAANARARAAQQAAEQALDRLRQAQEDMRRAASDPQTAADAGLAAQRLREASRLLAGAQSQEATDRLGSMAREADRLTGEEKNEADRIKRVKERVPSAASTNASTNAKEILQLSIDRQRMADDLSKLEQNMRNAARELDSGQRGASDKLRRALEGMDQADLETRLQRTADWLRSGIDPNGNGTESQIASGLQRLSDELHQAQQALVAGGPRQAPENAEAALNGLERLRRQIEALGGQNAGRQPGQGQQGNYQTGQLSRNGQPGQQDGQGGQQGAQSSPQQGAQGGQGSQGSQVGPGGRAGGNIGPGGGRYAAGGYQDPGWIDTGNNARPGPPTAAAGQPTPAGDPQQTIQQGLSELNQLRRETSSDPEVQRQIQELITAMEHLDLRRFPGNPAMVEELHQRLLSGVDTLELRLRRDADDKKPGQIRSTDPTTVPAGYKDAVADYFRRLSTPGAAKDRDK